MNQQDHQPFDPISALMGEEHPQKKPEQHHSAPQKHTSRRPDSLPDWRQTQKELPPVVPENMTVSKIKIISFMSLLLLGCLIGLLLFLRPATSETEKRNLTKFPAITWSSFWSGEFTKNVSLWYADTYPLREGMIRSSQLMKSAYGIHTSSLKINERGEDIPTDVPDDIDEYLKNLETESETGSKDSTVTPGQTINNLFVSGDTAYELYAFNQASSLRYAQAINRAAASVEGKAKLYDILVPLSYSVNLNEATANSLGASNAKDSIRYMFDAMNDKVIKVRILEELLAHKDEYLYFRTDHHWTATGAYYAYTSLCREIGITPSGLDSFNTVKTIPDFLGTLYADAGKPASLASNPDSVITYRPNATNDITHYDANGVKNENYGIISGVSKTSNKYLAFLGGDFPYSEIHNPNKHDGSAILLVKESFGNAFAPFLVDSFEYVYIVDYRYYTAKTLPELVSEKNISHVVFLNNLVATSVQARINELNRFVGE